MWQDFGTRDFWTWFLIWLFLSLCVVPIVTALFVKMNHRWQKRSYEAETGRSFDEDFARYLHKKK